MIPRYHEYIELQAFHMARKSRDFEPFVKPNSAPALALKARNTSGGTITWIGLFFPSKDRWPSDRRDDPRTPARLPAQGLYA